MKEKTFEDRAAKSQKVTDSRYNIKNAYKILEEYYKELGSQIE